VIPQLYQLIADTGTAAETGEPHRPPLPKLGVFRRGWRSIMTKWEKSPESLVQLFGRVLQDGEKTLVGLTVHDEAPE
jgi:hypothetical protein